MIRQPNPPAPDRTALDARPRRRGPAYVALLLGLALTIGSMGHGAAPLRAQTETPTPPPTPADLIVDGQRVQLAGDRAYRNVIVRNRGRIEIQPYSGSVDTGRLTIRAERFELDRTSAIIGDYAGFRGLSRQSGEGPGGGEGGLNSFDGGGGGAHGGDGGAGVLDGQAQPAARGGRAYGANCSREIERGSAGGAPGAADSAGDPGRGGHGGAALTILADRVAISGTIQIGGEDGTVVRNDAGGGGAGGGVWIEASQIDFDGRIEANGGKGGETDDGGGGGGGGRVKIFYIGGTVNRRAIQVNGGRGDGNGYPNDGRRGSICIEQIPPTPTPEISPTPTASPTATASATPTPSATPIAPPRPRPSATAPPSATASATRTPSATPSPTALPRALYLPLLLREACPKIAAPPLDIVLVIDASTSMRGQTRAGRSKLEAAIEAARVPVALVGGRSRLAIVSFNQGVERLSGLSADPAALGRALDAIQSREGSRLDAGLLEALALLEAAAPGAERRIVALTDGLPSPSTPAQVRAAAAAARDAGVQIEAIGLGGDVDAALLAEVAGSPERYHAAPDAEDLRALFADMRWQPPVCGGLELWPAAR